MTPDTGRDIVNNTESNKINTNGVDVKELKNIKPKRKNKVKTAPKMNAMFLDGMGRRVFVSEEKQECFGINSPATFKKYCELSAKERESKLKKFRK